MAYTKQTWNDLPNTTTPITAEKLNHIEDGIYGVSTTTATTSSDGLMSVNDKLKLDRIGITSLYSGNINTKTQTTLSGENVNYYDFIGVEATVNTYDHRRIINWYRGITLTSISRYQLIQYDETHWDNAVILHDHIIDTSNCTNIGTNGCRITGVFGVKIN